MHLIPRSTICVFCCVSLFKAAGLALFVLFVFPLGVATNNRKNKYPNEILNKRVLFVVKTYTSTTASLQIFPRFSIKCTVE
jgi:hypothetical protein